MRTKPTAALFLIVAAATATAQTNSWELSQPGAKLFMGIDVKSLRESAVGQSIREQMKSVAPASGVQSLLQGPMQAIALRLVDQVDRIFVSSAANSTASGIAGAKNNPPFLVVVEGRFPLEELSSFLKGTPRRYRDADVYRTTQSDTASYAFIKGEAGSSTLLLGDEKSVLAAIGRRGIALIPASALLRRAQTLAATHDFWIIADGPLSRFQPSSGSVPNPLASQIAGQVKGLDMGLALRDGFRFELSVAAESDEMAAQMTQLLSTQIQIAMLAQANNPQAAEISRKLHITADGNRVQVSIALSKDELEQQLRVAQAARAQVASSFSAVAPSAAVRPAKPATRVRSRFMAWTTDRA